MVVGEAAGSILTAEHSLQDAIGGCRAAERQVDGSDRQHRQDLQQGSMGAAIVAVSCLCRIVWLHEM